MPAEWEEQQATMVAWPYEGSDWSPYLRESQEAMLHFIEAIIEFQACVLLYRKNEDLLYLKKHYIPGIFPLYFFQCEYDDTWLRDYGPITVRSKNDIYFVDFVFNGWGKKFLADRDNKVTLRLGKKGFLKKKLLSSKLVIEGGNLESNGHGNLLASAACLVETNRNANKKIEKIRKALVKGLRAERMICLSSGQLLGDDTDGHIDTLCRFVAEDHLVYHQVVDVNDEQAASLLAMEEELKKLAKVLAWELTPLPTPKARYREDGTRVPLSYVNFVFVNGAVLIPAYGLPEDKIIETKMTTLFPSRKIIALDSNTFMHQGGSLHCLSMQFYPGTVDLTRCEKPEGLL